VCVKVIARKSREIFLRHSVDLTLSKNDRPTHSRTIPLRLMTLFLSAMQRSLCRSMYPSIKISATSYNENTHFQNIYFRRDVTRGWTCPLHLWLLTLLSFPWSKHVYTVDCTQYHEKRTYPYDGSGGDFDVSCSFLFNIEILIIVLIKTTYFW